MTGPRWRAVGATVTGSGHRLTGCQDAHRAEVVGPHLVVAVADGAGSARLAATGAALAADTAVGSVMAAVTAAVDPATAVLRGVADARAVLEDAAEVRRCPLGELATTLLVAAAVDGTLATAQVGDGALVVLSAGDLATVDPAPRGEYLNETTFLTTSSWADHLRTTTLDAGPVSGLAAMSDGLQTLALDLADGSPHAGFFEPLWSWLDAAGDDHGAQVELAQFLSSERVAQRADDDLTLVVARRVTVAAPA